jgi:type III restriction enzyme
MSSYEVPEPILNSPFEEPKEHWLIVEGEEPQRIAGRRPAMYYYRDPKTAPDRHNGDGAGIAIELRLVNRIRERVKSWREAGYPGVTRTTFELLHWWRREGREKRLFFAQLEAAETIIFLFEARADFRQGLEIPRDDPGSEQRAAGYTGFTRYACKMATGAGKTTVMGMLAAWSILNKVNDKSDARFSEAVLVVCPNVTIRERLRELDPDEGEASVYLTRDLIHAHLMPRLTQGRVHVTNWHDFQRQSPQVGNTPARVVKTGVVEIITETVIIGDKTTNARGKRYMTLAVFEAQVAAGTLRVVEGSEKRDREGGLVRVTIERERFLETERALVNRVLRGLGGKEKILVMNDEAHHAYRIRHEHEEEDIEPFGEEEAAEEFFEEATVWIDGLDQIHRQRKINFCLDMSATPYFLARAGQATNRPFPWVVSDFGLIDAIESGMVKIPQLAVRDSTGARIPGYFNIWRWILPQLTPSERGGKKASPKPEAILKYAHHPIAMLGGLWEEEVRAWAERPGHDRRPPVFIIVCKNTQIAQVVYDWLANNEAPTGIPPVHIEGFKNNGARNTIRVDTKVVYETDTGEAKSDEMRWMRLTLDTVGKTDWPRDRQKRSIYPEGFKELAEKLKRPLHPPGRDVRCIISVGMLTEGWDCNTVTHIVGLRPFMSQLLCEQVVGRGLRRTSYEIGSDGKFHEEVAKIFGVPFEVLPFKVNKQGLAPPPAKRYHVHALPSKAQYRLTFPRVEGYTQAIRNRITVDWSSIPPLTLEPGRIPPEVEMKSALLSNHGRPSLIGPGRLENISLNPFRSERRMQELIFDIARAMTRDYTARGQCLVPTHVLFPQLVPVVERYIEEKITALKPADKKDIFLAPYYGWVVERLIEAIRPDTSGGESPEVPRYEINRGPGSTADVDFWTSREVHEVIKSHLNFIVADTKQWEQAAAYHIDNHPAVKSFVKNASLGFSIPYLHNGQAHDYEPDFLIQLELASQRYLILEIKGYDPLEEVKGAAAERWVAAINADRKYGQWHYAVIKKVTDISHVISSMAKA